MKLFTGFTRIAHTPPFANVVTHDSSQGYWSDHSEGGKVFLHSGTNRIWIPRALRGRNPGDVSKQDFDAIDKSESGDASYRLWLEDFKREKSAEKLFDGMQWTAKGMILVDRLKKYIIKSKLDNAQNFGLPLRYSVRPELFDKLLQQTNSEQVRSIGRSIGKKYRIITELLRESGKERLANKLDGDWYYHYNKLEPLFDFDPSKYNPKKATHEPDENEGEVSQEETLQNICNQFVEEAKNIMDPQMEQFSTAMSEFVKTINKNNIPIAQQNFTNMSNILIQYVTFYSQHQVGQASERILQLPSFILLHHRLFEDSSN